MDLYHLDNHHLKPLPEHIITGHVPERDEEPSAVNVRAAIPISLSVLRVLLGIIDTVENANPEIEVTQTAANYYDLASFVVKGIKNGHLYACDKIKAALLAAERSPIKHTVMRDTIYA